MKVIERTFIDKLLLIKNQSCSGYNDFLKIDYFHLVIFFFFFPVFLLFNIAFDYIGICIHITCHVISSIAFSFEDTDRLT